MFTTDLLISFVLMGLLFLRQVVILRQPNKINYAPLMITIGGISSVLHFIIHPENTNLILLLRESLIPFLVALIFFVIMNILHQTQRSLNAKMQDEITHAIANEIAELKKFILELEQRMQKTHQDSMDAQEEIRKNFINDVKILETIVKNQEQFAQNFKTMEVSNQEVQKNLQYFSDVQLPELDNVVHKHIDILRVAEQDHYNKLSTLLQKATQSRFDLAEDIEKVALKLEKIGHTADTIAQDIITTALKKLTQTTKALEGEMVFLKTHADGLKTSLLESETKITNITTQSEMVMNQIVLVAKKMEHLDQYNTTVYNLLKNIEQITDEADETQQHYKQISVELQKLLITIQNTKAQEANYIHDTLATLIDSLNQKIDTSLQELHEHYHTTSDDITKSVQILAKKAQLQKGYGES